MIVAPADELMPVVLEETVECSIFFRPALLPSVTFIRKALDDPEAALMTRAKSVAPFLTTEAVAPRFAALIAS